MNRVPQYDYDDGPSRSASRSVPSRELSGGRSTHRGSSPIEYLGQDRVEPPTPMWEHIRPEQTPARPSVLPLPEVVYAMKEHRPPWKLVVCPPPNLKRKSSYPIRRQNSSTPSLIRQRPTFMSPPRSSSRSFSTRTGVQMGKVL